MNDTEPIEIEFAVKNYQLKQEFDKMIAKSADFDKSVDKSKAKFAEFIESQLRANGALSENAQLTDRQTKSLERQYNMLDYLKKKIDETTDPTQVGIYTYQLQQAEEAIKEIINASNTKVELLNSAELAEQNRRLEEAGRTLDMIADKSINIASTGELEVLAKSINEAGNEMEQLGVVIDFVESKLSTLDPNSQLFADLLEDIDQANQLLGRTPQIYDTAGNSIDELTDALKAFKAELATATNPDDIRVLNQNIEQVEQRIKQLSNAGKSGFDEFGNKISEQRERVVSLQTTLEKLVQDMAKLRMENKANSQEYETLKEKATAIRSALATVNQEVNATASSTSNLDTLIRATSSIAAGFNLAQGAAALFGNENEEVQETIKKVTASMAILQSLQTIQAELKRQDSLLTQGQTAAQALYARVVGTSTGALKAFRIALAATGVGLFIILLAELVANWDKVKNAIGLTNDELERTQEITGKANDLYGEQIAKLQLLEKQNRNVTLSERQKRDAVREYNKEFGDLLGSVKDYKELEEKVIANVDNYVKYLNIKAQADAAYILSLEKQKLLLEQITALSTGDLDWWEKVRNKADAFWDKLGIGPDYDKYEISSDDIRRIMNLPNEEAIDKELANYAPVIRNRLKKLMEEQAEITKYLTDSTNLTEQASTLAKLYGISPDEPKNKGAEKLLKERLKVLKAIADAEQDYLKNSLTGLDRDIKEIENRYAKLRQEAEKVGLGAEAIKQIDLLEANEITAKTFEYNSDELIAQLEKDKELFKLYEEAKTLIGAEAIEQRYADQLKGISSFSELLQQQIDNIEVTPADSRTLQEQELLERLLQMKKEHEQEMQEIEDNRYLSAYENALTHQEQIMLIESQYIKERTELEKIADADLRDAKIAELTRQKNERIAQTNEEYFYRKQAEQRFLGDLTAFTKRELQLRVQALQEYLELRQDINEEEKKSIQEELNRVSNLIGSNDYETRRNALIEKRQNLEKQITDIKGKDVRLTIQLLQQLEAINDELFNIEKERLGEIAGYAGETSNAFGTWSSELRGANDELSEMLMQLEEAANDVGNIVNAFSKDWVSGLISVVSTAVKYVIRAFSEEKREEERREEERRRRNKEAYAAGLEYNRMLRERWLIEAGLNDLYQSRVENIREELAVMEKQKESVYQDYAKAFGKVLGALTKVDMDWVRWTGYGDGGEIKAARVWKLLGFTEEDIKNGIEYTDELFEKLEQLNSEMPLTGDAKEAFEVLQKLKEEYGSIEEAQRQYEIELQNRITGTTAQTLVDSIKQGISEGKRSFADFADDIEGFLRNAILSGMSTAILEPKMQELQDLLYNMLEDGTLTEEEREEFQNEYMKLAREAQQYLDMINQAGIDITGSNQQNSLKGAIKGITEEQADLLAGQFGGMRLAQLETNTILRNAANYQMSSYSRMITLQEEISFNTNRTAFNTSNIVLKLQEIIDNNGGGSSLQSAGIYG